MNFEIKKVKIVVMVSEDYTNKIRNAVCDNGAGVIGNYSYCTTNTKVVGTFIPNENANPFIGDNKKLEFVNEDKLEFICDIKNAKKIISVIRDIHPYEEPSIDIIPLIDENNLT